MKELTLYESHEKLILQKVFSFYRSFGVPVDELKSEANVIFMETLQIYDESKSKFITFLFIRLDQGLLQFIQRWRSQLPSYYEGTEEIEKSLQCSYKMNWREALWDKVKGLSKEAEVVVLCITDGPEEIYHIIQTRPPRMVRGAVVRYLRNEKGWSWPRIWSVFREIKEWIRKGEV